MARIVTDTGVTDEGEMLWCVHFMSSYYDDDPRWPGTVPVDSWIFVLAKNRQGALTKADSEIQKARSGSDRGAEEKIEVMVVTLEDLVPARARANEGRLGTMTPPGLSRVFLSNPDDLKRYRLGVCLIPIEE